MKDLVFKAWMAGDSVVWWVLAFLGALVAKWVLQQIGAGKVRDIVGRALHEVGDAVKDTYQTFVKALKEAGADGRWTDVEMKQAKAMAIATAKKNLGKGGLRRLARVLGLDGEALDDWLGTKVEAAVSSSKAPGGASAASPPPKPMPAPGSTR